MDREVLTDKDFAVWASDMTPDELTEFELWDDTMQQALNIVPPNAPESDDLPAEPVLLDTPLATQAILFPET